MTQADSVLSTPRTDSPIGSSADSAADIKSRISELEFCWFLVNHGWARCSPPGADWVIE